MSRPQNTKAGGAKRTLRPPTSVSPSTVDESGSFHSFSPHRYLGMRDTSEERSSADHPRGPKLGIAPQKSKLTVKLPELAGAAKDRIYLWRRRAATLATASLALVMAYGVVFGHNGLTAFAHKREEAKTLQQQMQQLQRENDRLHEHVNHLQNDPDAIEHEAREELHYTRSGEVIYTLPNAGNDPSKASPAPNPTTKD